MRYYTGIGSRKTPSYIQKTMRDCGSVLAERGYALRSGGADGADTAFEQGCDDVNGEKEIYLPWKGFNNNQSELYSIPGEAYNIAETIYGARWRNISLSVRHLMARNMCQVTGKSLDTPSEFVICWTPDGCTTKSERTNITGGTGQAIAYSDIVSVPVFNLKNNNVFENLMKYIETLGAIEW